MAQLLTNQRSIDGTIFTFPEEWKVALFDEWPQFRKPAGELGVQGCDAIALDDDTLWIIEAKDYTYPDAHQPEDLPKTVGLKAIGTMAILYSLQRSKTGSEAADFAEMCAHVSEIKLALHIEVKDGGRKSKQVQAVLMPLKGRLSKVCKSLGLSKAYVTSTLAPDANTPWESTRDPATRARHLDR